MNSGRDVSVVVQGPVYGRPDDPPAQQLTRRVLATVRSFWPEAEIILSTWKGADAAGLTFDAIIHSDDPGAVPLNDTNFRHIHNNLNRQLVSSQAGLALATRPYAVKLRTDCVLQQPVDFAGLEMGRRATEWSVLQQRVLTLTVVSRHPLRRPVLFHGSDIFHAGLLADLRRLWNVPLVLEPGFTRAIDPADRPAIDAFPGLDVFMRCAPEQYLMEQLAREIRPELRLRHQADGSAAELLLWLRILANNFLLRPPAQAGLELPAPLLAKNAQAWDFFRDSDNPWLDRWTAKEIPGATRALAIARFRLLRLAYRRSRAPLRPFWQRALGRALRAAT